MTWRTRPLLHALLMAGLLRIPLLLLPGPGRDEAAYHYWAWHPELFYAPLLQWMLRLSEALPLPAILTLRLPSLVAGMLVLVLVDARLRRHGAAFALRSICLLALVVSEWQAYTGAILHPDQLLLASLLLAVLAASEGRVLLFAGALVLASLAKPTGLLLLPVGWFLVGRIIPSPQRGRVLAARLLMVASLVFLLARVDREMLEAMAQFGQMDAGAPWLLRIGGGLAAVLISGGPLLLLLAASGLRERIGLVHSRVESRAEGREANGSAAPRIDVSPFRDASTQPEAWTSLSLAAVLLAAFGLAAITRGQIKANWVLPAAVILLPLRPVVLSRGIQLTSLLVGLAFTLLALQAHLAPQSLRGLESTIGRGPLRYTLLAGSREAEVSPTRSWEQRVSEYQDLRPFVDQLDLGWSELGAQEEARWVVSDDYGLASQILWYRHNTGLHLVVPQDGIYHRELDRLRRDPDPGLVLLLGVQEPVDDLSPEFVRVGGIWGLVHPITGETLQMAVGRRRGEATR